MSLKWCPRCCGAERHTCIMCKFLAVDDSKERGTFLAELYNKAKKFNMPSIGYPDIDEAIIAKFGDWRSMDATMKAVRVYERRFNDDLKIKENISVDVGGGVKLHYAKLGMQYRICIQLIDGRIKPWNDCDRSVRNYLYQHLPKLAKEVEQCKTN